MTPLEDAEPDHDAPPRRMMDGSLVPVGLCPVREAREKERRERWGARAAVPRHGGPPNVTRGAKGAKDRL